MAPDAVNDGIDSISRLVKAFLAMLPAEAVNDVKDRAEILEQLATPEAKAAVEMTVAVTDMWGSEELAPSDGTAF